MGRNFMNRANRDAAWKAAGGKNSGLRRTSIRNQLLHPMYVEDYEKETGVLLTAADRGLGNTIYKTLFAVLYQLESDRRFDSW